MTRCNNRQCDYSSITYHEIASTTRARRRNVAILPAVAFLIDLERNKEFRHAFLVEDVLATWVVGEKKSIAHLKRFKADGTVGCDDIRLRRPSILDANWPRSFRFVFFGRHRIIGCCFVFRRIFLFLVVIVAEGFQCDGIFVRVFIVLKVGFVNYHQQFLLQTEFMERCRDTLADCFGIECRSRCRWWWMNARRSRCGWWWTNVRRSRCGWRWTNVRFDVGSRHAEPIESGGVTRGWCPGNFLPSLRPGTLLQHPNSLIDFRAPHSLCPK
mmetsp:Transcript_28476/g.80174  ORF Transcript_28476/g.80174 Transcript_28476/m.80174 type:complete len:270 (-) Transcript_28476:393-1202(-)